MKIQADWNRNNKFKKSYIKEMQDYFNIESSFFEKLETATKKKLKEYASNLPTLQGFLSIIKVDRDIFVSWLKEALDDSYLENDKNDKIELLDTFKKCREISEHIWITNSLKWLYSSSFANLVGKNIFWWNDRVENTENQIFKSLKKNEEAEEDLEKKLDSMEEKEIDNFIIDILS